MAEIWLARQSGVKGFEKLVVIKRMTSALEADPEHIEMFLGEARLAAQLNHQHVVQIFELGEDTSNYFIAMEYLDGENLSVIRRRSKELELPMTDGIAARLVSWAAEGLHYAHTRVALDGKPLNLVHRDVSPQNLIVTYDGGLKVVDFGIAKVSSQATMSGKLKGKLAYMSPEQARAQAADARSDLFALGIVLFELVTGSRLMPKMEDIEILAFLAGMDPMPRPSERRADVPRQLENIIVKALARRREDRYQTARDLQDALDEWIRSSGQAASSSDVSDYMHMLFADRIREKRALIETAMSSELTPNAAKSMRGLGPAETQSSINSGSQASFKPSGRWLPIAGLVAVALAVVGLIAFFTRDTSTPKVDLVPVDVPVVMATLMVDSEPAGAVLELDGQPSGKAPGSFKTTLGEHKIAASLEGHEKLTRVVKLEKEGQHLRVVMALMALAKEAKDPQPNPNNPAPVRVAKGKLTLKTDPWTSVFLGKNKLGDTPLINFPLPAGKHLLRVVTEAGAESSIEVEIKPNDTTVKKLRL